MKKITVYILALMLCVGLSACGRGNDTANTNPETMLPSTDMNILPDTMPTGGTNIPDANVDTQMPIYTQGTNPTEVTDSTTRRRG